MSLPFLKDYITNLEHCFSCIDINDKALVSFWRIWKLTEQPCPDCDDQWKKHLLWGQQSVFQCQYWKQPCSTSFLMIWMMVQSVHLQQVCWWHKTKRTAWYTRVLCCLSKGPWQAAEADWWEAHETQKGKVSCLACGEEQPPAPVYAGGRPAGKQPGTKGSGGLDGQVEHKTTTHHCPKGSQWYPGLH